MPNLVGIGLSQVPTNSMLGGLAYQDPEHASIKNLDLKNLSQINSEIADTASDVFVYDTSKDSDGGAWRKRTQNTSWYNETLNTSTRGSRKEFPAVAVITVEDNGLTIYDGDDPDLSMWMKWTSTTMLRGATSRKLAVKNGIIALSGVGTYNGLIVIYFISDTARSYRAIASSNNSEGFWKGNIAGRNDYSSNNYSNGSGGNVLPAIVSENTKDVAMTVLPNAPIDSATGLPIPTIAVATPGGASIIRDDGTVADLTGFNPVDTIHIDVNNIIASTSSSGGNDFIFKTRIPASDEAFTTGIIAGTKNYYMNSNAGTTPLLRDIDCTHTEYDSKNQISYRGGNGGIDIIAPGEAVSSSSSKVNIAYIASDYNTGYMHGDIKGAFLSDTSTTNVTGTNLIANGDFSTSSTAAFTTVGGGTAAVVSGLLRLTDTSGSFCYASAPFATVIGKQYFVSVDIVNSSNTANANYIRIGHSHNGTQNHNVNYGTSYGTKEIYITATATTTYLTLISGNGSNETGHWDNISITLVEEDRSVNNKGLQVFGTVTKSAVATGAELVAYGPFNNSNNFRQPYNSDLNFEQNDFSIMFWVYDTGVDQHCTLISRDEREFDISRLANAYGNKLRIYTKNSSETLRAPDSTSALPQNKWVCVCVVYTGGNTKNVYLDGKLDRTITGTDGEYDIDSTSYGLNIGVRSTGGTKNYSAGGIQLALMRIGGGAPSSEQIKKMYEDEKHLFQENAACTLYGSSDAVTALAFDEVTDQLHVGTSAGRSDFQGLRRINNTTTAVTTAISAHDEFIIEQ